MQKCQRPLLQNLCKTWFHWRSVQWIDFRNRGFQTFFFFVFQTIFFLFVELSEFFTHRDSVGVYIFSRVFIPSFKLVYSSCTVFSSSIGFNYLGKNFCILKYFAPKIFRTCSILRITQKSGQDKRISL